MVSLPLVFARSLSDERFAMFVFIHKLHSTTAAAKSSARPHNRSVGHGLFRTSGLGIALCGLALTPGSLLRRLLGSQEIVCRIDERDVGECLRKVSDHSLADGIVFFSERSEE